METGHTEVMQTLVSLCRPSPGSYPSTVVEFEPIRSKMLDLYGASVGHPDFYKAFQLVLDAGGADSPHMLDLQEFQGVLVNPKIRKLRFETYGVVAPLPVALPRVKNAILKWTWKQAPVRGWCPLPPNLLYRLDPNSKVSMWDVCGYLEKAMAVASQIASAVAESIADKKAKVKWLSEVDIGLIQRVISEPKHDAKVTFD